MLKRVKLIKYDDRLVKLEIRDFEHLIKILDTR